MIELAGQNTQHYFLDRVMKFEVPFSRDQGPRVSDYVMSADARSSEPQHTGLLIRYASSAKPASGFKEDEKS